LKFPMNEKFKFSKIKQGFYETITYWLSHIILRCIQHHEAYKNSWKC
jgi:hypothetical protein